MKKILAMSLISVFVLTLFAIPALVSAATCQEQCVNSGYLGTNLTACRNGCNNQGDNCRTVYCDTTYEDKPEGLAACKKGCSFISSASDPNSPITDVSDIEALIRSISRWLAILISVIGIIFIILGGASYITSGGDEEKAGAAKKKIIYGLIGLAIAMLAWGAESLVRSFLLKR